MAKYADADKLREEMAALMSMHKVQMDKVQKELNQAFTIPMPPTEPVVFDDIRPIKPADTTFTIGEEGLTFKRFIGYTKKVVNYRPKEKVKRKEKDIFAEPVEPSLGRKLWKKITS